MSKLVLLFSILAVIAVIVIILLLNSKKFTSPNPVQTVNPVQSSIPSSIAQPPFKIISTDPPDNTSNVYPGEIILSFTTDQNIFSDKAFSVDIQPQTPQPWKIITTYPTRKINIQILGGLNQNTKYTVTVKSTVDNYINSWSFITSGQQIQSSSAQEFDLVQQNRKKYVPLFDFVPYSTPDFDVDYTDKLTLQVKVKNQNLSLVKQEVNDWVKSKGVDPATHTINYINNF